MTGYKTILIHLNDDVHSMDRLTCGLSLARIFKSHLMALYTPYPCSLPLASLGACPGFLAETLEIARAKGSRLQIAIERIGKEQSTRIEWRMDEGDPIQSLATQSLTSDLVIISPLKPEQRQEERILYTPETLVLQTGCPVITLPGPLTGKQWPRKIALLWQDQPQSLRAGRLSLPLLERAEDVLIFRDSHTPQPPVSDMISFLNRHGIQATMIEETIWENQPPFFDHIKALEIDLLVMGADGYTQKNGIRLNSLARDMMVKSPLPIFLSH